MEWRVERVGDETDIDDVRDAIAGMEWSIVDVDKRPYLTAPRLAALADVSDVLLAVSEFLDILAGGIRLVHSDHRPVQTGNVIGIDSLGKTHHTLLPGVGEVRIRCRDVVFAVGGVAQPSVYQQWLAKAERDTAVRDALHFMKSPNWWNLYKVYEVISRDVGGEHALDKRSDLVSERKLTRFRRTAQSRYHLGDDARHGVPVGEPPKNPMSLPEAQDLIGTLFRRWVATT